MRLDSVRFNIDWFFFSLCRVSTQCLLQGSDPVNFTGFDNLCEIMKNGKRTCDDLQAFMKIRSVVQFEGGVCVGALGFFSSSSSAISL